MAWVMDLNWIPGLFMCGWGGGMPFLDSIAGWLVQRPRCKASVLMQACPKILTSAFLGAKYVSFNELLLRIVRISMNFFFVLLEQRELFFVSADIFHFHFQKFCTLSAIFQ